MFFAVWSFFLYDAEGYEVLHISRANIRILPDFAGDLRHTGSTSCNSSNDSVIQCRFPHFLLEQVFRLFEKGRDGIQIGVFNIILNAQLVVHLKQILRCTANNSINKRLVLIGEIIKIMKRLFEVKGENLHLRRPPAVKRSFIGKDVILHIGHRGTAEDKHQFRTVFIFINQKLKR